MWKVISTKNIYNTRYFKMRSDTCELPDGRVMPNYYVVEFPDWVQVVALTKNKEMVLVDQYRHAAGISCLEIPGGSMHPVEDMTTSKALPTGKPAGKVESPLLAAQRELREETGYISNNWSLLAHHYPNPALQSNAIHTFLAVDCEKVGEPTLDPYECLEVKLMPCRDVYTALDRGELKHSLIVSSLALARAKLGV